MARILDFNDSFTSAGAPTVTQILPITDAYIAPVSDSRSTHLTWEAYLADSPQDGDYIFVNDQITVNTTITLTNSNLVIEHSGDTTYTKGTATTCFDIQGDGITFTRGRFAGFNGGGDIAIDVDAAADFTMIRDVRFNDCDRNISDNSSTSSVSGIIDETP